MELNGLFSILCILRWFDKKNKLLSNFAWLPIIITGLKTKLKENEYWIWEFAFD